MFRPIGQAAPHEILTSGTVQPRRNCMRPPPIVRPLALIGLAAMFLRTLLSLACLLVAAAAPVRAQELPQGDLVGTQSTYTVVKGDSLAAIARKNQVGFVYDKPAEREPADSARRAGDRVVASR